MVRGKLVNNRIYFISSDHTVKAYLVICERATAVPMLYPGATDNFLSTCTLVLPVQLLPAFEAFHVTSDTPSRYKISRGKMYYWGPYD